MKNAERQSRIPELLIFHSSGRMAKRAAVRPVTVIVAFFGGLVVGVVVLSASCFAAEPTTASPPRVDQVIVVFKTHFDIGYTQLAREVVDRYRTSMIDKALAVCDATDKLPPENRFVWTIPGWPMQQILWPGQDGACRVWLPEALRDAKAQACDLRGRPVGTPLEVRDGTIEVPLGHFAPASILLTK